jgi:hypothetical protein
MLRKSQYRIIGFWQFKSKVVDLFWIDLLCVLGKILDVSRDTTSHPINRRGPRPIKRYATDENTQTLLFSFLQTLNIFPTLISILSFFTKRRGLILNLGTIYSQITKEKI